MYKLPEKDLTGLQFGKLKVLEYVGKGKWKCECQCEKHTITEVKGYNLINNRTKSCGCERSNHNNDIIGQRFGDWIALEFVGDRKYLCECQCENKTRRIVSKYALTSGHSKSCGHDSGILKDITGQTFGELTVLNYVGDGKWECRCSCNNIIVARGTDIRSGNTTSCGHTRANSKLIDLSGQTINEWKVLEYAGNSYWKCVCVCGEERIIHSYSLRNGLSKNCGSPFHRIINIKGQKFGELEALEYVENGMWKCKCSCGNIVNVLGCNLRNGSTSSCGCKTDKILRQTLRDKYGDTCPSRANNPRTTYQIELINNRELLEYMIKVMTITEGRAPKINEIAEILGVTTATARTYIEKYEFKPLLYIGGRSSYELELEKLFSGATISDRKALNGMELDMYFEDKKTAIEFNGTYWHSSINKDYMYHQNKTLACIKNDIRLIHIFEYEWNDEEKKEKIINMINNQLGRIDKHKIYAKDTIIKEISNEDANRFLDLYHLQNGNKSNKISLGCYYNNNLIGVMTFGDPRFNKLYEYELIRLCWHPEFKVVGGSNKLFNCFIEKYNPISIVSYCDISKFSGKVYTNLGFRFDSYTKPSYVWVSPDRKSILSRYQTQKHKLIEQKLGTEDQTEDEIMSNLGYLKIYNSGNAVYTWNNY